MTKVKCLPKENSPPSKTQKKKPGIKRKNGTQKRPNQ